MKKILSILTILSVLLAACTQNDIISNDTSVQYDKDGNMILKFTVTAPEMKRVATRSVDADGWGLQNTYLYNFNKDHLCLGRTLVTVESSTSSDGAYSGTFSAKVPPATCYVHLISNLNEHSLDNLNIMSMNEIDLISSLETTSSLMGYWGRSELKIVGTGEDQVVEDLNITLIRNQACIALASQDPDGTNFTVTGFEVFNMYASGMVAPFHEVGGDDAYAGFGFGADAYGAAVPFVSIPQNPVVATDPDEDTMDTSDKYIFEHPNDTDKPIYVILKGHMDDTPDKTVYYKVSLMDKSTNDMFPIYRNHRYVMHIAGTFREADQSETLEEAKKARSINNVWVSLDSSYPKISGGGYTLDVKQVVYVIQDVNAPDVGFQLEYDYSRDKGGAIEDDKQMEVFWLSNEGEAFQKFDHNPTAKTITVYPSVVDDQVRKATLLLKAGPLRREITLIAVKHFQFDAVWSSTNINISDNNELVTLLFTIPQDFPSELFPLECRISASGIDTKEATKLPVINLADYISKGKEDEWWGKFPDEENTWGYKYVYMAEETGAHRVYFLTSLSEAVLGHNAEAGDIYLEAPYFETTHKQYTYSHEHNAKLALVMDGTSTHNPTGNQGQDVLYKLAAPRTGDVVNVEFHFEKDVDGRKEVVTANLPQVMIFTNTMVPADKEEGYWDWSYLVNGEPPYSPGESPSNGGFYYLFDPNEYDMELTNGIFKVPFRTTIPLCADVIRIAVPDLDSYRSASFELSHFNPFLFLPDNLENEDVVSIDKVQEYGPKELELQLYVNKVMRPKDGRTGNPSSSEMIEVSPGESVTCFIDTKNYEPVGSQEGFTQTETGYKYVAETGEVNATPHTLKFIPKSHRMVTAESIIVRSDESQVAFKPLEVKITNTPITGTIQLNGQPVDGGKVTMLTQKDGTRIGTFTIGANGSYTLKLKGEYDFGWYDALLLSYEDADGNAAELLQTTLSTIMSSAGNVINFTGAGN